MYELWHATRPHAGWVAVRTAALRRAPRIPPSQMAGTTAANDLTAPEMSLPPAMPGMGKPPSRYDVTVRVGKDDGHQPDPAAFAAATSQAAPGRNISVVSAHTAGEIICLVCVAAPRRPAAVAVALAVVADALRAGDRVRSPSR